ncbi:ribonuclease HII [Microbacterium sp. SORGH_AS_0888]|uniref:ribonuclease HII n=1 Tax=Microbacterium sp. SORGH_AS_0888 TaxID=3041791 RepID=UPI00278B49A2|nr:ribonuclease HII [Microbacterium sp. SORGH_AS_0888]MDQ1128798.1 ribonuclease HII [Microbacterium sp. SORGH_AS_0888]
MTVAVPTLGLERRLLREHPLVVACDEVGRGALAGPVAVGAAAVGVRHARRRMPDGLRDSKLIPESRRAAVAERAAAWVEASAVGWASSQEVDEVGIIRALGIAAHRAIAGLGLDLADAVLILDGNHDYISLAGPAPCAVTTVVKADRDCASAAAASVVAKVARDGHMVALHETAPAYGWLRNKGYASLEHRAAIREHGLSVHHRTSWAISDAPTLF